MRILAILLPGAEIDWDLQVKIKFFVESPASPGNNIRVKICRRLLFRAGYLVIAPPSVAMETLAEVLSVKQLVSFDGFAVPEF